MLFLLHFSLSLWGFRLNWIYLPFSFVAIKPFPYLLLNNKSQPRKREDLIGFSQWLMNCADSHLESTEGLRGARWWFQGRSPSSGGRTVVSQIALVLFRKLQVDWLNITFLQLNIGLLSWQGAPFWARCLFHSTLIATWGKCNWYG